MIDETTSTAIVTGYTRTYVSGSSGFDTSSLIEAAVEAKLQPAYDLLADVEENETEIAAYQEMQGCLSDLMDALDPLRNESGSTGTASVFDSRAAYLTASDGTDSTDYLAVTVDDGTEAQSLTVEVQRLATEHKVGSGGQTSCDQALGLTGSFTLGTNGGDSAEIAVDADMTLEGLVDAINNVSETSGVRASVLKVSDSEYRLILSTKETGQTVTYSSMSGDDIGFSLGIMDGAGAFANELQAGQDAVVLIDGVVIQSSTNSVDDALSGIQLDLYAAAAGTKVTVDIEPNYSDIKDAIEAFVTAYNTYRDFALTNQEVSSAGAVSESAILFGDSVLRTTNSYIYDALSQYVETGSDEAASVGSIGITFDGDNKLVIDEAALDEAIVDNTESVAQLFEFQFESSSDDLQVLRDDSVIASGTYSLDITTDVDGNITGVSVDGEDSLFTVDGTVLTGADGGPFAGLKLVYTGSNSASIDISISQGIADRLYDSLDGIANSTDGTLAEAIADLEEENDDKTAEAADITTQATAYEARLIDYYANLEAEIQEAQIMLDVVKAILGSDNDD
ncbi:MAG: flagellar filament capping protein FliD [Rhodospirillales bacterium]|nr:flagellar filament capping protein FliD [Rhodospirillales bacterium]